MRFASLDLARTSQGWLVSVGGTKRDSPQGKSLFLAERAKDDLAPAGWLPLAGSKPSCDAAGSSKVRPRRCNHPPAHAALSLLLAWGRSFLLPFPWLALSLLLLFFTSLLVPSLSLALFSYLFPSLRLFSIISPSSFLSPVPHASPPVPPHCASPIRSLARCPRPPARLLLCGASQP
jgi:hypothetical protein